MKSHTLKLLFLLGFILSGFLSFCQSTITPVKNGGTGLSTYTIGNLIYASGTTTFSRLPIGSSGQTLIVSGGVPTWSTVSTGNTYSGTAPISVTGTVISIANIPNSSLANSTISGVALGSNLFNHTIGYGLSGSSYNGSSVISWAADTTVLGSKLYIIAKLGGYQTTLNGTGFVFQSGTSTSYSSVVTGTYGGTGVNNGSKTITLGGSFVTTGTSTPTLAFPTTTFTYTYPGVSTTMVGQTGTSAANYIPVWNDANQITGNSAFQWKNFDVGNSGFAVYLGNSSTNNFVLGNYNLTTNTTILNCPTAAGDINTRFQNGANISNVHAASGIYTAYYNCNLMVGNTTTPASKLCVSGNTNISGTVIGQQMDLQGAVYTDPAATATRTVNNINSIETPTIAATNTVTYTDASTFYIANAPAAGTNITLTRKMALWVAAGIARFDGGLSTSIQYTVPVTTNTVVVTSGTNNLVCNPAGLLATLTVTFPPNPINGQPFGIAISQIITAITLNTSDGSTIDGTITTSAANSHAGWVYSSTATAWFQTN